MKSLISKVILIGVVLGILTSVFAMIFGLIIYYVLGSMDFYFRVNFIERVAILSIIVGIVCASIWYMYLLFVARKYFLFLLNKFIKGENK